MRKTYYFDNASTSFPKAPGVGQAMCDYLEENGRSVGRGGYRSAQEVGEAVVELRERLCALLGGPSPRNTILTPGVTFALNQVLFGLLQPGDRVVTSSVEHNAVARPLHLLEQQGVVVERLSCDDGGALMEGWREIITPKTRLVVLTHASNVSGALLPIDVIGRHCRENGIFFCVDAAQTAGCLPLDMGALGIDALAVPGHKGLLGPQGIGALLLTDSLADKLAPLVSGGTGSSSELLDMPTFLPDRFEAGTMNLPGVYGLLAALRWRESQGEAALYQREAQLTRHLLGRLREMEPDGLGILGPAGYGPRAGVVPVVFPGVDNAKAAFRLEQEYGVQTRCGLHCAPMAHTALGTYPQGTVRFSVSPLTSFEDIDYVQGAVCGIMGV